MDRRSVRWRLQCSLIRLSAADQHAAAALLPRAKPGWTMAAQTTKERVFAHFAVQHNRTLPDYITTIEAWLAGHIRHARVHLRMRVRDFEMFLRDDRYRTQFEGMRSGGAQHVSARILVEETVLGVPASSRPLDRPI